MHLMRDEYLGVTLSYIKKDKTVHPKRFSQDYSEIAKDKEIPNVYVLQRERIHVYTASKYKVWKCISFTHLVPRYILCFNHRSFVAQRTAQNSTNYGAVPD